MVRTIVMAALLVLGSSAIAQETSRSILVLDGSGSMWGQIDGTAKITIAQDVVSELMGTMPETQELGLTVYGHRKKGDCSDIQTLVEPGLGNRPAIVDAVRAIKPKGKTPMIDAVKVAAEALRFTEEEATVVLISDGFETCNADPCAAARALDDAGVNFTAHVVGFDVDDADALAQMQCIADETGGQFVTAADASELTRALDTVVAAPEPIITTVTFNARLDSEDGAMITDPISWTVIATDETTDLSAQDNPISFELTEGSYEVVALWSAEKQEITKQFVTAASAAREITLVFESPDVSATIIAPETAQISSTIEVAWDGPNDKGDYVGIGLVNAEGSSAWENYTYTAEGSPLQLLMPPNTGAYAITYFQSSGRALASAPITLEPVKVEITAPEIATAGETIELSWTGPNYEKDYIGIGLEGAEGSSQWENYTYTEEGATLQLQIPAAPGDYRITYFLAQDREALVSVPISVEPVSAGITAPETATAGETIELSWTGPNYEKDYIGIGLEGAKGSSQWENYTYTEEGATLSLLMPPTAGKYEISYFTAQDRSALTSTTITIAPAEATLIAPSEAVAGSEIEIGWTGPDYSSDYIAVGPEGAKGSSQWQAYAYTSEGNPVSISLPAEPGTYILRYFMAQDKTSISEQKLIIK